MIIMRIQDIHYALTSQLFYIVHGNNVYSQVLHEYVVHILVPIVRRHIIIKTSSIPMTGLMI